MQNKIKQNKFGHYRAATDREFAENMAICQLCVYEVESSISTVCINCTDADGDIDSKEFYIDKKGVK